MQKLERRLSPPGYGWSSWHPVGYMEPSIIAALHELLRQSGGWASKLTVHHRNGDRVQYRKAK